MLCFFQMEKISDVPPLSRPQDIPKGKFAMSSHNGILLAKNAHETLSVLPIKDYIVFKRDRNLNEPTNLIGEKVLSRK